MDLVTTRREFHDEAIETESADNRRARLDGKLRATLAHAWASVPRVRRMMDAAKVTTDDVRTAADLSKLPITLKDDLGKLQSEEAPLGGLAATDVASLKRLYASPGPIFVPQGAAQDFWRLRWAFAAAGLQKGEVVLNTLSYNLTPGGFMLDGGLRALGCVVIPAGVGQTDLQVRVSSGLKATGYTGTPSFLRTLLHRGRELNVPLYFQRAFATAEMLPESLRKELQTDFGVRVQQGYVTADLGTLAYECSEKAGLHVQPECILEILDLETGKPAAPGQPGQVVGTTFDPDYPLIRFATGDVSALLPDADCACGRTTPRLQGLLGRVGDAVKVKGLFVRGSQIEGALKAFPEAAKFQAVITRADQTDLLTVTVELQPDLAADAGLPARITEAIHEAIKVRGEVKLVPAGTLPAGFKRLDDRRVWT